MGFCHCWVFSGSLARTGLGVFSSCSFVCFEIDHPSFFINKSFVFIKKKKVSSNSSVDMSQTLE